MRTTFSLVFILVLAGCAAHRSRVGEVEVPLPEGYVESPVAQPKDVEEAPFHGFWDRWWESFGDVALNDLMGEAFAGNLDLAIAYARLEQLLATTRITASAQSPILDLRGQGSLDRQPGVFADHADTKDYRLSLAAAYEVDLWRKLDSRTRAAELEAMASREDIQTLYLSLSAQVADFYYLAVEQRAQLDLTDRTIASFEESLDRVQRRYRAGLVPSLDVYQARQNLAVARSARPLFEAGLALARHALTTLLGRFPDLETGGDLAALPESPFPTPAGLPATLLARRPDIRAAFRRLEAGDAAVAAAVADRFPTINLLGSLGGSKTVLEAGTASGVFWNLLASLVQPVFDAGRRLAEVERSEAAFRERVIVYRQAVLDAIREVEDALSNNRTSEKRIVRLVVRVDAAEASLRAATERYMQGLSDYLPVLTAQATHAEAQSLLLSARRQLISDRISLLRALGGDWMGAEVERRLASSRPEPPQ